jgi:FkbM family methyltransferase
MSFNYKKIRKFLRPVKKLFYKLISFFSKLIIFFIPNIILDYSLERRNICQKNKIKFSIRNYGKVCRFRSFTFATKEPDTLEWIESFDKKSIFLDIGANVGIYSIYASYFAEKVYSFEPDALNYSMLNLNIYDNKVSHKILAYPLALHNTSKFNTLNIQSYQYGGALSSFENKNDQFQKKFIPIFNQGCFSMTLDDIYEKFFSNKDKFLNEIHCKIDVDGNENLILEGSKKILRFKKIKSFLVELDTRRDDYKSIIKIFKSNQYKLISKKSSPVFKNFFGTTQNHIFHAK